MSSPTVLFCLKQTQDMSRFSKIIIGLQIPEYPLRFLKIHRKHTNVDYYKESDIQVSLGRSPLPQLNI